MDSETSSICAWFAEKTIITTTEITASNAPKGARHVPRPAVNVWSVSRASLWTKMANAAVQKATYLWPEGLARNLPRCAKLGSTIMVVISANLAAQVAKNAKSLLAVV